MLYSIESTALNESMNKTQGEFLIPEKLKIIFLCPEIFDCDLLIGLDSFRVEASPGGIMSPCPKCKKQKCMKYA